MKESKLLCQVYEGYCCYAKDIQEKEELEDNIPVLCEFRDVFPEEFTP